VFVTYPKSSATANNWIHICICFGFSNICHAIDSGKPVPVWPEYLPVLFRDVLFTREKLPVLFQKFSDEAHKLSSKKRLEFLEIYDKYNQIDSLLDNTISIPTIPNDLNTLIATACAVCEEGFRLLSVFNVRHQQYKMICDHLETNICPFCGYEHFEAPGLAQEDEDHYLSREFYPLAAANLHNLVPMGDKCNKRYKLRTDMLHSSGIRRKALNPYGNLHGEIVLLQTNPIGNFDFTPTWIIDLSPNIEEIQTWDKVFSVKKRILENFLLRYYDSWIEELRDWFKEMKVNTDIHDENLFIQLDSFADYARKHDQLARSMRLKSKVIEMLVHHCRLGNRPLIAMIRDALPHKPNAA
jgi:hypothetical protein